MESKKAILVVSFGTGYLESIESAILPIEKEIGEQHPGYEIRRAFTSPKIVRKLKRRDNIFIDNTKEALQKLLNEGFTDVVIQPTYVIAGYEYDYLKEDTALFMDKFRNLALGEPLLAQEEDFVKVAKVVHDETVKAVLPGSAVVFMGHGTEHSANSSYERIQKEFSKQGFDNYFIGTVDGKPDINDLKENLTKASFKRAELFPFMIVSGDHANNDMAGDNEGSWKSILQNAGIEVKCHLKGMGEYPTIRKIIEHKVKTV